MEIILPFIVGAIILFFGRSLFWVFVGVAGFLGGYYLAKNNLDLHPQTTLIVVACIVGALCAVISIFLQKLAIAIAGFFSGGYLAMNLVFAAGIEIPMMVAFVIGGIIGALLVWVIFDWALILLSALTGTLLITQGLQQYKLSDTVILIAFIVLFMLGIASQAAQLRKPKPAPEPSKT